MYVFELMSFVLIKFIEINKLIIYWNYYFVNLFFKNMVYFCELF